MPSSLIFLRLFICTRAVGDHRRPSGITPTAPLVASVAGPLPGGSSRPHAADHVRRRPSRCQVGALHPAQHRSTHASPPAALDSRSHATFRRHTPAATPQEGCTTGFFFSHRASGCRCDDGRWDPKPKPRTVHVALEKPYRIRIPCAAAAAPVLDEFKTKSADLNPFHL